MKGTDTNLWGIHGGKTGDADTLFLKKNCVADELVATIREKDDGR